MFMKTVLIFLCLGALLLFSACRSVGSACQVLVVDERGEPIERAELVVISLSIDVDSQRTYARRMAYLPSLVQEAKWLSVGRRGYKDVQVAVTGEWPLRVTLKK